MLLYFEEEHNAAMRLGEASGLTPAAVARHRFPDGEVKLRLPDPMPRQVVVLRTLDQPNEKLVELLLVAQTARSLGATHLTLVTPYLAYMRQDMAFAPGEAISQRIVGAFLATLFDAVITVDPHLHRVATLQEAVPVPHAIALTGADVLSDLIATRRQRPMLVGPDSESEQWVAMAAARHGFDYVVCSKVRSGDHAVEVVLPQVALAGRAVVILDDVASTGHTVAAAARLLRAAGAASIDVAVTHALLGHAALDLLREAGVGAVWSTDCIEHPSNAVSMAPAIAQALREIISRRCGAGNPDTQSRPWKKPTT